MIVVPIGQHHYLSMAKDTYVKNVVKIADHLEYGCLEGKIDGRKEIKFWEKEQKIYRIQEEVLLSSKSFSIDLDSITRPKKHLQMQYNNAKGDKISLKSPVGNMYSCGNCSKPRSIDGCNVYGHFCVWDQNAFIRETGTHENDKQDKKNES